MIGPYRGNGALLAKQLAARAYLTDYYSFTGAYAERIAASALTSAQKVADTVAAFTDAGCDELILFPCNPDLAQVPLTAQAAGL